MKKLISILLIFTTIFTIVGCSTEETTMEPVKTEINGGGSQQEGKLEGAPVNEEGRHQMGDEMFIKQFSILVEEGILTQGELDKIVAYFEENQINLMARKEGEQVNPFAILVEEEIITEDQLSTLSEMMMNQGGPNMRGNKN